MIAMLMAGTVAFLATFVVTPLLIARLRRYGIGQQIRDDGPIEHPHAAKAGTPTMGGIIIFTAFSVPFLIMSDYDWRAVGVFTTAIACALLGFADDYTKIVKRRSLGLRSRW